MYANTLRQILYFDKIQMRKTKFLIELHWLPVTTNFFIQLIDHKFQLMMIMEKDLYTFNKNTFSKK